MKKSVFGHGNHLRSTEIKQQKKPVFLRRDLAQLEEKVKANYLGGVKEFSKAYEQTIATLLLKEPPEGKALPPDSRTMDSKALLNFHEKSIMAVLKAGALSYSYLELKNELAPKIDKFIFLIREKTNRKLLQPSFANF